MPVIIIVNVIVSLSLILGGYVMKFRIKDNSDTSIGFRTEKALKNNETWLFANRTCGKIWLVSGISSFILSVVAAVFSNNLSLVILGLQISEIIFSALYVENQLKNKYH
jgi:uncharacterized membrane protein